MSDEKKQVPVNGEKKEKAPKESKPKEVKELIVKCSKAKPSAALNPATGTRFEPNTARQLAFDIVLKMTKEGKSSTEIRKTLAMTKKASGSKFSLDAGYFNFTVANHPEFFKVWNNGKVEVLKEPKPDPEAAKKLEEEKKVRKEKALKAREERKKKAEGEKAEKKEKVEEKPSKVEKKN